MGSLAQSSYGMHDERHDRTTTREQNRSQARPLSACRHSLKQVPGWTLILRRQCKGIVTSDFAFWDGIRSTMWGYMAEIGFLSFFDLNP